MHTNKFSTKNKSVKKIPEWILRLDKVERMENRLSYDILNLIEEIPKNYKFSSKLIRQRILELHDPPIYKCENTHVREVIRRIVKKGIIKVSKEKVCVYGKNYIQYYRE
tara:strand:- start:1334 stop:1660 length:327 start_codon:yes stop_codon:yes gene_type:complete